MSYLSFISEEKGESSKGLWIPTVVCQCGNSVEGDEPKVLVEQCEQCEGKMSKNILDDKKYLQVKDIYFILYDLLDRLEQNNDDESYAEVKKAIKLLTSVMRGIDE